LLTRFLHLGVNAFQGLRRCVWFFSRPRTVGVHGIPLTPEGKVVLVTLSYAKGWRLPGGGRKAAEKPREALLRELQEEIGLTGHTGIELVGEFRHQPDFRRGEASLFVVRGVQYQPRWSLEVVKTAEFELDELPPNTAAITHQLLAIATHQLP
jgi:8-oxo-dGTP pyrophosphatase MutT (NUDIX family)